MTTTAMSDEDPWAQDPLGAPGDRTPTRPPAEPAGPREVPPVGEDGALVLVPSVDLLTLDDPLAVAALCRAMTTELLARVASIADTARAQRPQGRPSVAVLGPELRDLARAGDALGHLARVMTAARAHAAHLATEAMVDVLGERRRSARVSDGHGSEITVSLTPRMETSADEDQLLDVLGTLLISGADADDSPAYALGVREGIALLRQHLPATLPWKTSALTATSKGLAAVGEDALAARLDSAWARVEVGDPTAKLDVKAPRA